MNEQERVRVDNKKKREGDNNWFPTALTPSVQNPNQNHVPTQLSNPEEKKYIYTKNNLPESPQTSTKKGTKPPYKRGGIISFK